MYRNLKLWKYKYNNYELFKKALITLCLLFTFMNGHSQYIVNGDAYAHSECGCYTLTDIIYDVENCIILSVDSTITIFSSGISFSNF